MTEAHDREAHDREVTASDREAHDHEAHDREAHDREARGREAHDRIAKRLASDEVVPTSRSPIEQPILQRTRRARDETSVRVAPPLATRK
jgi:hypothetical protein